MSVDGLKGFHMIQLDNVHKLMCRVTHILDKYNVLRYTLFDNCKEQFSVDRLGLQWWHTSLAGNGYSRIFNPTLVLAFATVVHVIVPFLRTIETSKYGIIDFNLNHLQHIQNNAAAIMTINRKYYHIFQFFKFYFGSLLNSISIMRCTNTLYNY